MIEPLSKVDHSIFITLSNIINITVIRCNIKFELEMAVTRILSYFPVL